MVSDRDLVREATLEDLAPVAEMLHTKRLEYEPYSPVFWRVATNDTATHRVFLEWMVASPDFVSLVTADLGGCLFARQRPGDWLVDDFAVVDETRWSGAGSSLLAAAIERVGFPLTVVCGARDAAKRTMLRAAGFESVEEWWVGPTVDQPEVAASSGSFEVIDAPPVYDPGGPVAMVSGWDGASGTLRSLSSAAAGAGAVLLVVPVATAEVDRRDALAAAGLSVASEWYLSVRPS
jgi:hypothetical protein